LAHQHKAARMKIRLSKINNHDGVSHSIIIIIIVSRIYNRPGSSTGN